MHDSRMFRWLRAAGVCLTSTTLVSTVAWGAADGARAAASDVRTTAPSGAALIASSEAALIKTNTFTVNGSIVTGTARIGIHIISTKRGDDYDATLTSSSARVTGFVGEVRIVEIGPIAYLNGSRSFWASALGSSANSATLKLVANRWIKVNASQAAQLKKGFASLIEPAQLAKQVLPPSRGQVSTAGTPTTLRGHKVIPVTVSGANGGTIFIEDTTDPLPIELTGRSATSGGTLVFSYPAAPTIAAPAGAVTFAEIAATISSTGGG